MEIPITKFNREMYSYIKNLDRVLIIKNFTTGKRLFKVVPLEN